MPHKSSLPEDRMPDCKTFARGGSQTGENPKSQFVRESLLVDFWGGVDFVDCFGALKLLNAFLFVFGPISKPKL